MYDGPRRTVKVPQETLDSIKLLATVLRVRQWQVIDRALVLLRNQHDDEVKKLIARRRWGENVTPIRERIELERDAIRKVFGDAEVWVARTDLELVFIADPAPDFAWEFSDEIEALIGVESSVWDRRSALRMGYPIEGPEVWKL